MSLSQRAAIVLLVVAGGVVLLGNQIGQDKIPLIHDGRLILRVRVGAGGMTPLQRAEIVQRRLIRVMDWEFATPDQDLIPAKIHIKRYGNCAVIACGPLSIITVTSLDARANRSAVAGLAGLWRERIAEVLDIATDTG